jgi:uncharacterized protein YoxC
MQVAYYLLWLVITLAVAYAFVQLGLLLAQLRKRSDEVINELLPLMKNLNETLEDVNTELDRVNSVVERVEQLSEKVTHAVAVVREVLSSPLGKVAGFSSGARAAIDAFIKGK